MTKWFLFDISLKYAGGFEKRAKELLTGE